jgi:hypothetical protein
MLSAFGVDHGEVSKGILRAAGRPARRLTRAQRATRGAGGPSGPQKVAGAVDRALGAPISVKGAGRAAGKGMGATGRFFEQRPGLTGTALVGGGGYAGYKYLKQSEPKRKKAAE